MRVWIESQFNTTGTNRAATGINKVGILIRNVGLEKKKEETQIRIRVEVRVYVRNERFRDYYRLKGSSVSPARL